MTHKNKLLTEKQILEMIPLSRVAFLDGVKSKIFPQPIYFGKLKFWHEDEINKLLQEGTK